MTLSILLLGYLTTMAQNSNTNRNRGNAVEQMGEVDEPAVNNTGCWWEKSRFPVAVARTVSTFKLP
jgi:hypothetical protein